MLVRNRSTGAVITQDDFRAAHPNTSFPAVITPDILNAFGHDPVMAGAQPTGEPWQHVEADGVEQVNGQWFTKWKLAPDVLDANGLQAQKELKLAALAAKRWEVETGPFTMGEMTLVLDEKTTNKLDAAYMFATRNPAFAAEWKLGNGAFVTLDAATVIAIGDAVGQFVQACFAREKALTLEILAANDFAELVAVDLDSGWPT